MLKVNRAEAHHLYTQGNNDGLGFAPYTDTVGDETVLENEDGEVMAIGNAYGAWAVMISDLERNSIS